MIDATTPLTRLPTAFTLRQATEAGLTRHVLARLVRSGVLTRSTRGVYTRPFAADPQIARWERLRMEHLVRCRRELAARPGHAVSHFSAAVLRGLPLQLHPRTEVHLTTVDRVPRSRRRPGLVLHHSDSMVNATEDVDGMRVTTLPRTLADVLRSAAPRNSVPLVDHAIRSGSVTRQQVEDVLSAQRRWRGRPRAIAALDLVDPGRESWLESYSFVTLAELGMDLPIPQVEVYDEFRQFVARVDGLFLHELVATECDGFDKYLIPRRENGVSAEESTVRSLVLQNNRQKQVERLGVRVERWTTSEIRHDARSVFTKVATARREHSPEHFTGWLRVRGVWLKP